MKEQKSKPKPKKETAVKKPAEVAKEKPKVEKKAVRPTKKKEEKKAIALFGLHNLVRPKGSHKARKIKGRGPGSGHGKTSTRGSKGQTSRAGRDVYPGFEGGQMPLIRKIPKRGFTSRAKDKYQIVNLKSLVRLSLTQVSPELLFEKGLIDDKESRVKILGDGEVKNPISVKAHAFSDSAAQKIKAAGGTVEIINV